MGPDLSGEIQPPEQARPPMEILHTPGFKTLAVEAMQKETLSYRETARQFEVSDHHRIQVWGRIYLTEGPEGFLVERRSKRRKGRPSGLPKQVEEDAQLDKMADPPKSRETPGGSLAF